ncbi:MAG TPA: CdaR family protein [Candidatus Limnocylindrales bacterium]|nr:CdaR family protein [Candidatus Limnocylindrales bacterium]
MRRVTNFLLHNWPLKLGAIILATVLYSGLVLGQNTRTWVGEVPVEAIRPPAGATLISDLEPITVIRYRAPLDVGVLSPSSFVATADLSDIDPVPGGPPLPVTVNLIALDPRVDVIDFAPQQVQVQLDPVQEREMPVDVTHGTVPDTINVAPAQVDPSTVIVRGASSRVASVAAVEARVPIDASALNIDREVDLIAVDVNGNQVPNIEIQPERARVRVAVAQELATRTLPVVPQLVGEPATGYRITSVTVEPLVVTVSGEAASVSALDSAPTVPIDVTGRTSDLEAMVAFALPADVSVSGSDQVRVVLEIAELEGTQTFLAGVTLEGARSDYTYSMATTQINVTLGGSIAALDAFDAAALSASAQVSGLAPGSHIIVVTVLPPPGLQVIEVAPTQVSITVVGPTPSPNLSPSPSQ